MPTRLLKLATAYLTALVTLGLVAGFTCEPHLPDGGGITPPDSTATPKDKIADHLHHPWVDSVMQSLTPDERIAQLFMVAAYSNKKQDHVDEIVKLVEEQKIGGLIFFQGGPVREARLTNLYQSKAKTPLLISIDGEWGLAMRLDSTIRYPRQMMLGAIQNDSLIYNMGRDIAEQCKRMGIHVNLAPVVDVNNNPRNPVIGSRSFGEDKVNVAKKGIAYMNGMQDQHLLTTAKHFPGHGDTDTDSHKALPVISHSKYRLNDIELYPFKELINAGLGGMMVAHLYIPALDSTPKTASTLSHAITTDLLKTELGFDGLIFTDALNMKGVSSYFKPGEVDRKALLAGNDVLLFPEDVPTAIAQIKAAIAEGQITQEEIDRRVRKLIAVKHWVGLDKLKPIDLNNLTADLNHPKYDVVKRQLVRESLTLVKNDRNTIPVRGLDTLKIASLSIGDGTRTAFQTAMKDYADVDHYSVAKGGITAQVQATLLKKLKDYDLVLVGIHEPNRSPAKGYGITEASINLVNALRLQTEVVLDVFANPYSLNQFQGVENIGSLIVSYNDSELAQQYSAQLIFGGIPAKGKLPVSASPLFPIGMGKETANIRFEFSSPEDVMMSSYILAQIDDIANGGITDQAYPGCQVLVAKDGKVIYRKAFGHHTYEKKRPVRVDDLYDLASITKVAASTLSLMRLQDEHKFDLSATLHDYLPGLVDSTPYRDMKVRDMLAHQAGLTPWIPFYTKTLVKGQPRSDIYSLAQTDEYPFRVCENLYIQKDYPNLLMQQILQTPLRKERDYKYSDIGYYFFQRIIEAQSGLPLNEYVANTFYKPMALRTLGYRPREHFPIERIVPTEYDLAFRKQLVHGDVHDPGAAMTAGVGGHAGLFSDCTDLAALMQMMIDSGHYGGDQYLSAATLEEFTRCQFCRDDGNGNRRGAGFDKPVRNAPGGPTCECVAYESFGHSGFTGTIVWADPKANLVYVFLSNRIYPAASNKKLITSGIRTQIQQVIYDAINEYDPDGAAIPLPTNLAKTTKVDTVPGDSSSKGPAGR